MAVTPAETANLALVRPLPNDNYMVDGLALSYTLAVMRGLGSTVAFAPKNGRQLIQGAQWNAITASAVTLGSAATFPKYPVGMRYIRGQDFNQLVTAVRALNV